MEQCAQGVDSELRRVSGGRRNASDGAQNLLTSQERGRGKRLSADQFGERRPTGDGGNAALSLKSDFGDNSVIHESCEFQNVPACGILELNRGVVVGKNTGVARVLEMIEELRRVHGDIVGVVPTSPKTGESCGTPPALCCWLLALG